MNHNHSSPSEWLDAYVGRRARLASEASEFQCEPDCTRPGCKSPDLQVPVSLVDIVAAARHRGESMSAPFRRHYVLGLFYNDTDYCLRTVSLKLQKPCPFLADDLCSLYPVRPLPCILFPEILVHRGTFAETARNEQFRDYRCLRRPLTISPERARVLATLRKMWERESLVTSYYLFGQALCHLDFTELIPELLAGTRGGAGAPAGSKLAGAAGLPDPRPDLSDEQPAPTVHQVLEGFFQAQIAGLPAFCRGAPKNRRARQPRNPGPVPEIHAGRPPLQKTPARPRRPGPGLPLHEGPPQTPAPQCSSLRI